MHTLPETGFFRLHQIIGNPKAEPPVPGFIPISKSSWWLGVANGIYPAPVKLGPKMTAWRAADIRELINSLGGQEKTE